MFVHRLLAWCVDVHLYLVLRPSTDGGGVLDIVNTRLPLVICTAFSSLSNGPVDFSPVLTTVICLPLQVDKYIGSIGRLCKRVCRIFSLPNSSEAICEHSELPAPELLKRVVKDRFSLFWQRSMELRCQYILDNMHVKIHPRVILSLGANK